MERFQQERPHQVPRCAAGTRPGPTPCKADHRHLALEQSIPAPNAPHLALNPNPTRCTRRPRRPEKQQAWPAPSLSVPGAPARVECSDTGPWVRAAKGPQPMCRIINVSDGRTAARLSLQAQHTRPLGGQGASGGPEHLLAAFCPLPAGAQLAQCRGAGFLCPPPRSGRQRQALDHGGEKPSASTATPGHSHMLILTTSHHRPSVPPHALCHGCGHNDRPGQTPAPPSRHRPLPRPGSPGKGVHPLTPDPASPRPAFPAGQGPQHTSCHPGPGPR